MKRVLFVITKDDVGGAQKYVADLAAHLDPQKFSAEILCGGTSGARFLSNAVRPYFLFLNDIAAIIELALTFSRKRPDIIHLNSSKTGVIGALASCLAYFLFSTNQKPGVVFTAHGWVFNPTNALSPFRRRLYILLHRLAARMTDVIINVSEYDRQLALKERIAPPEKLVTILNGAEPIEFLPREEARQALLQRLTIHNSRFMIHDSWIGSIGRLTQEKNYEALIDAAAALNDQSIAFFIIGDGAEKKKLELRIMNNELRDRFFIISGLAPAAPYLRAFDAFVLPSIKEGLPYTILEAMHAGVPIIAAEVGGMPEVLRNRAALVPPRDPNSLAEAIRHALANPHKTKALAEKAREFARKELTLMRMVAETERVYGASNGSV